MTAIKIEDQLEYYEQICIKIGSSCLIWIVIRKKD